MSATTSKRIYFTSPNEFKRVFFSTPGARASLSAEATESDCMSDEFAAVQALAPSIAKIIRDYEERFGIKFDLEQLFEEIEDDLA